MMKMRLLIVLAAALAVAACASSPDAGSDRLSAKAGFDMAKVGKGRELVLTIGCNDCHTRGYLISPDTIPMDDWLTGNSSGMQGPWGTLYPSNLRLLASRMEQDQWISMSKHMKATPMMPWSKLRHMSRQELDSLYQFIRYLGPKGTPAPAALPPR